MCHEGGGEGVDALGPDRQAGRGAMAAKAFEVVGARAERGVQVERTRRAPRALPGGLGACDENDRPPVTLDEPGGDDADHPLVPVLACDDIPPRPTALGRPGLDLVDRSTQDAL